MIINGLNSILSISNSNLINGLSNISQFINVYQSTKSATYAQLATEIINQNDVLEHTIDKKNNDLLSTLLEEIKVTESQNKKIIEQNELIIQLLNKTEDEKNE